MIGKPITVLNITEAACLGVAMRACAADTGKALNDLVSKWIRTSDTIYPQSNFSDAYDQKFKVYKKIYPSIRDITLA